MLEFIIRKEKSVHPCYRNAASLTSGTMLPWGRTSAAKQPVIFTSGRWERIYGSFYFKRVQTRIAVQRLWDCRKDQKSSDGSLEMQIILFVNYNQRISPALAIMQALFFLSECTFMWRSPSHEWFDVYTVSWRWKRKTCRCNDNDLQDIGGRKIGPDLSIEPLQKHFCFFDVCSV